MKVRARRGRNVMSLGKGALLWLIGIPLPIIILLVLFWRRRARRAPTDKAGREAGFFNV